MQADSVEPDPVSEDSIAKALEAARARVSRAQRERAELERVIAAAREEQRLLERLLALRRGTAAALDGGPSEQKQHDTPLAPADGTKHPVVQAVIEELKAAGRALHISELMRILRDRNVTIPGLGTQANLITHLRRDERLVRPSRGMYGLAEWGLENMPAARRKRRRRRHMRSTIADGRTQS